MLRPVNQPSFTLTARLLVPFVALMMASSAIAEPPLFTDVAVESGLDFTHWNGMSGEYYFPEMTGQGAALFDFDNDGDLDVYLVQGALLGPGKKRRDAWFPYEGAWPPSDRLFRNDLKAPAGAGRESTLKFTDVTAASGLAKIATGYGMGVAAGDFDNDGYADLYVTNYGANQLLRNQGDGTFRDVTSSAGVDDSAWSTSATFFDFDRDGLLDLFLANYVVSTSGVIRSVSPPAAGGITVDRRRFPASPTDCGAIAVMAPSKTLESRHG